MCFKETQNRILHGNSIQNRSVRNKKENGKLLGIFSVDCFCIFIQKIYNFILSCFFEKQKKEERIVSQKIYGENLCLFVSIDITLQSNLNWKRFLQIGNLSLRFFFGKVAFWGFKVIWGRIYTGFVQMLFNGVIEVWMWWKMFH